MLPDYWYSTQPFIAWVINHYFYGRRHYCWVASPFYPYRLDNPRSSRPMDIYRDYYESWKDKDRFSDFISSKRISLDKGVMASKSILTPDLSLRLRNICRQVEVDFFYPVVYRIDLRRIDPTRLEKAASALIGSKEYRIQALEEHEFDVMFFDATVEGLPSHFEQLWTGSLSADEVFAILEGR